MNSTHVSRPARRFLTSLAVSAVSATCLVSVGAGPSASAAGDHRSDVSSATKEWKSTTYVPSTKEW